MRPSVAIWSPMVLVGLALAITGSLGDKPLLSAGPAPSATAMIDGAAPPEAGQIEPATAVPGGDLNPSPLPAAAAGGEGPIPAGSAERGEEAAHGEGARGEAQVIAAAEAAGRGERATPTASPTVAAAPTEPAAQTASNRGGRPAQRIALQAGHWRAVEQPAELASLRGSTGAEGPGWTEREVNLDIARRAARLLEASGFVVDVLPATVPERYQSDVFLSLHGDSNGSSKPRGFKVARGARSAIPEVEDDLVATIYRIYGQITGLPRDDKNITNNMRYYYAFSGGRLKHTVAPTTPAAILEMGFLTNESDRRLLLGSPDLVAEAVAASLVEFLGR